MSAGGISVTFNSVDLNGLTNVLITDIGSHDMPKRNVMRYPLARSEGQVQVGAFFVDRDVVISGTIVSTDQATFDQNRDSLMQSLTEQNANLDINTGLVIQRFVATVEDVIFSDARSGFGAFSIRFRVRDPFGINPNLTPALAPTVITAQPSTQNLASIAGTYMMLPKITVTLNSGSVFNTLSSYMKLTNVATGKYVQITRIFATAELIEIDSYNKSVQVNRTDVDFNGNILLPFALGAGGQIKYEDNFTTRNITLKVEYYKRYL